MGQQEKLLERARRSPANFSYKDIVHLAVMVGFKKSGGKEAMSFSSILSGHHL